VVYLTPKIERVISLLSASPVGEARCRCRKVWLTRIDYYYYAVSAAATLVIAAIASSVNASQITTQAIPHCCEC
jgi:hypothetical protein